MPRTQPTIAVAALVYALPALAGGTIIDVQLTPAGQFGSSDGRALPVPGWQIDEGIAGRVIARFNARHNPAVVDYEHQTLLAEANGQAAPAAGWITDLYWREGEGLFARVEFTARAAAMIDAREYLYVSPVFAYDPVSGEVLDILMAAITNNPAIDGMQPLALRAAAKFRLAATEGARMDKLVAAVLTALSLDATATEDQAIAALNARLAADPTPRLRAALGLSQDASADALVAACTSLQAAADPARVVPLAVLDQVKGELAALTAKVRGDEVDKLVQAGLADGRLLPAQEAWARALGGKDVAALTQYLETTTPIAALAGTQTGGKAPDKTNEQGLTDAEMAVCRATGIDPKTFAATKAA